MLTYFVLYMKINTIYCILLLLFITTFAQSQPYLFKRLGLQDGLSDNYIVSITQDRKGFMWFATESGLNRFDGYKFNVYKKGADRSEKNISGNDLNKVYADEYDDVIWIATQHDGLNMFDYRTETFTHYKVDKESPSKIISSSITDIVNSRNGNLWIATYQSGVEYLDKKSKTFKHYNTSTVKGMPSDFVWTVREDRKGYLYIGHVDAGLSILSLKDNEIKNFRHNPNDKESLPGNEVKAIFVDNNDNVWVGTDNGLALFNSDKESFTVFHNKPKNPNSLVANYIFSITQLNDGRLWIGAEQGGVSILDIKKSMFSNAEDVVFTNIHYSDDERGFSNPTIRDIYQDSFENIWFATYGGGINFLSHRPALFDIWTYSPIPTLDNRLSYPIAWGMCVDQKNRIWIGTDGEGLDVFDQGKRVFNLNKKNSSLTDNAILSAIKDSENNLWFGTFKGGVNIVDPIRNSIRSLNLAEANIDIRSLYEDGNKNVWLGSSNGIYVYNIVTKELKHFNSENSDLTYNLIRTISKDTKGRIWVGTFGAGLFIFDSNMKLLKSLKSKQGLPSNKIDYIYKDTRGKMWVATGEGLICFENSEDIGKFVVFDETNKHIQAHIRAITEDAEGNIWISSNSGISRYVPSLNLFYNYDHHNGVPLGDFMSGSVAKDSLGILYFGSQNGVCYFDPEQIPMRIDLSPTVITDFKIYNDPQRLSDNEKNVPVSSDIELNYDQNTFTVSFNVLDYSLNNLVDYAYKLKGLEDLWYDANGENSVTFRNLPPGNYILMIKSKIKNQEWSDSITMLKVVINPPLWRTWWAYTIYLAIMIVIVWAILRFYKNKLELENNLILEKKNRLQEQDLNDERIRFFTNITHELRTPLTLIVGPLEDLEQDTTLREKHVKKVVAIHRSANRLLDLINQILEFRKTETQNKKLTVSKADISLLIKDVCLKYKELNTNNEVEIILSVETDNTIIYFDPDIISTIVENLVSNALKYTDKGSIFVGLREVEEANARYTEIEVTDTGTGIPPESLPRIFDRYYQAPRERNIAGTGIGLSLVQNLVSIHESTISVDSELGRGSSFKVRLLSDNTYINSIHAGITPKEESFVEIQKREEQLTHDDTAQQVILVVEDNDEIRDYIEDSLSEQYKVHTAKNGREGIEKAYEHTPDIIISDVMMPEMDGFELSRILKNDVRTSHIVIILLTAKDTIQDRRQGYDLGVESYITKPFSAGLLQSRISNLLDTRKKLAALVSENTVSKTSIIKNSLNKLDNEFLEKITTIIEDNLERETIDVAFIAERMNMSHSTLYRKVKALLGISINEFIRKVRIRKAESLLLTGKYTISEVSFMVGINSLTYFRQSFKDEFGAIPSEYLKRIMGSDNQIDND